MLSGKLSSLIPPKIIIIAVTFTSLQLYCFLVLIDSSHMLSVSTRIFTSLLDGTVCFLPFLLISPKLTKRIIFLPGLLVTLFCVANSLYFKAFSDIIPWESLKLAGTVDTLVIKSSASLFSWQESLIAAIYILELACIYLSVGKKDFSFTTRSRLTYLSFLLVMLGSVLTLSIRRAGIYYHCHSFKERCQAFADVWKLQINNLNYYRYLGLHGYIIRTIVHANEPTEALSKEELDSIKAFLRENVRPTSQLPFFKGRNSDKNLILIIVESLSSHYLTQEFAAEYLPAMSKFIGDSTVISALKVIPRTGPGRSSDAQFIYNTGLVPLSKSALIESHASANYPSLAKALGKSGNIEIIGESKNVWRHYLTTKSFGYDSIVDNIGVRKLNADSLIFSKGIEIAKQTEQPFFLQITTLSMHDPYDSPTVDIPVEVPCGITDIRDINYFKATVAFDKWLSGFIEDLKINALYDNSVIVIVSDHEPKPLFLSSDVNTTYIPLFILNSGYGQKVNREIDQYDIFPTILDIMGVSEYFLPVMNIPYRGVGSTLINPEDKDSITFQASHQLLERIVSSRLLEK